MPALGPTLPACECLLLNRESIELLPQVAGIGDLLGGAIAIGERSEGFDTPVQSRDHFSSALTLRQRLQHEGDRHVPFARALNEFAGLRIDRIKARLAPQFDPTDSGDSHLFFLQPPAVAVLLEAEAREPIL